MRNRQSLLNDYDRDGTVRIEGAFSAKWVEKLTSVFDRLIDEVRQGRPLPRNRPETASDAQIGDPGGDVDPATGRAHLRNAAPHDPALWSWVTDSPAGEIVGELTRSTSVQFWYDLWFCKEPSDAPAEGATPWHHDATGHPFIGSAMPSLWIALTDLGIEDAPLQTFRGSHRDPYLYRPPLASGKEDIALPESFAPIERMHEAVAAGPDQVQTWLCNAGDALLIHPMTWHVSLPQTGGGRRRLACSSRWIGNDVRYDPGPFAFRGFYNGIDTLGVGDSPPLDFIPVVWERSQQQGAA